MIHRTVTAVLILLYLGCGASSAQWRDSVPPDSAVVVVAGALTGKDREMRFNHTHALYDVLLGRYVRQGRVDYRGIIASPGEFNAYLQALGSVKEGEYAEWSREEKLAYWINAYNAFTIKAVVDNYPIKRTTLVGLIFPKNSILQISGVWSALQFAAAGTMVSLGEIEHKILRQEFKDPRIHCALVCASLGCPDLANTAYRADILDKQLEDQTKAFVNNPNKGSTVDVAGKRVAISKIFKWFGEDFVPEYGTAEFFKTRSEKERAVLNFVRIHLRNEEDRLFLERGDFTMGYLGYDWGLNVIE